MIRLYSSTISYHVMITRLNFASFASSSFTQVVLKTSSKAVKIKQAKKTASIYQPSNINLENLLVCETATFRFPSKRLQMIHWLIVCTTRNILIYLSSTIHLAATPRIFYATISCQQTDYNDASATKSNTLQKQTQTQLFYTRNVASMFGVLCSSLTFFSINNILLKSHNYTLPDMLRYVC